MRPHLILFTLLLAFPIRAADSLLLKNAHFLDPESQSVNDGLILIDHGFVKQIGGEAPAKFAGETIDLHGQWVVPGFHDMHTHASWGNHGPRGAIQRMTPIDTARVMLYAGVVAYVDLFADEKLIFPARDRQGALRQPGARIFAAGPMITSTGGHGSEFGIPDRTIDNPAAADRVIRTLVKERSPDVIKLVYDHARDYGSMGEATMRAAVATAKQLGLKTIVHIGTWDDARQAVQAGADVITHLHETEIPDDLVKLMKDKGTWEIPTMTYQSDLAQAETNPRWLDSPLLAAVTSPALFAAYHPFVVESWFEKELMLQKKGAASYPKSLAKLARGGVKLMTGTDSGGEIAVFQGFSVHREMQLFVDSGLTPWQALAASTTNANAFLGFPSGARVGSPADLVVLKSSPLVDIANTQDIAQVIQRGHLVDRDALLQGAGIPRKPLRGAASRRSKTENRR